MFTFLQGRSEIRILIKNMKIICHYEGQTKFKYYEMLNERFS